MRMRCGRWGAWLGLAAMLAGCGGSGGSGAAGSGSGGGTATGSAATGGSTTAAAGCSLRERQDWTLAQLREWYLFPETLPASLDPTPYTTVDGYLDALTATARAQRKDRYFTYLTSIATENAYYDSGSTAGYGIRLSVDGSNRLLISEAFEGAPALAAGIDRGTQIEAIGTGASDLREVSSIIASEGSGGLSRALGPDTAGTTRTLRIRKDGAVSIVTVSKADYELQPVSSRYGAKVVTVDGQRYGYLNLRTFINTADAGLRSAFQQFKDAGVTNIVVDVRYNGGGLVSIAKLMGDLLGGARSTSAVFSYTTFRPEKSSRNSTDYFTRQPQSIAPTRVAFIGTGGTASASELVIATQIPYLHANAALIGTNTYGKPVGQIALDRAGCDDRLRVIAFALQNANRQGAYFNGLAGTVEASCQAGDDLTHPLGDPAEASTAAAIGFLQGKSCTPIAPGTSGTLAVRERADRLELLTPDRPNTAQREVPGLF